MTTTTNATVPKIAMAVIAVAAAMLFACTALVSAAYANKELPAPTTVSDDITRLHVNKLDADTHEYVQGASMAIIEKDTGTVVDEWVTGTTTHENEKGLDVNKVYILREVSAPNGYDVVQDTEFMVNEIEGTGITILSGPGELTESYKVNLYDKAATTENVQVVEKTRAANESSGSSSSTNTSNTNSSNSNSSSSNNSGAKDSTVAPKTGDETPLELIAFLVFMGIVTIAVLEVPKRRLNE